MSETLDPGVEAALGEVLPRHTKVISGVCEACSCGAWLRYTDIPDSGISHTAHLAAALAPVVAAHVQAARADEREAAAVRVEGEACRHVFPDGTRCTLTDHSTPGVAQVHGVIRDGGQR